MTVLTQKNLYNNCILVLKILDTDKYGGVKLENGEYAEERPESKTTKELKEQLKVDSYNTLFDILNFLEGQNQITVNEIPLLDAANNARNKKENSKCTITLIGQKALRQKHYERLISDIEYLETLKKNNEEQHQSVIDTNKNVRVTNVFIWVSIIATVFSAGAAYKSCAISENANERENRKDTTEKQLLQSQKEKQQLLHQVIDAKNLNDSLYLIIDSLTKTK